MPSSGCSLAIDGDRCGRGSHCGDESKPQCASVPAHRPKKRQVHATKLSKNPPSPAPPPLLSPLNEPQTIDVPSPVGRCTHVRLYEQHPSHFRPSGETPSSAPGHGDGDVAFPAPAVRRESPETLHCTATLYPHGIPAERPRAPPPLLCGTGTHRDHALQSARNGTF